MSVSAWTEIGSVMVWDDSALDWTGLLVYFLLNCFHSLVFVTGFADCYDPLDPDGNITVTIDILQRTNDGYTARVTIQNYYQYRHIDKPGWTIGWTWTKEEVIVSMSGAFATQQGNCSSLNFQDAHCCKKDPEIADLPTDALPEKTTEGCCKGGLISAYAINPAKSFSSFEISVANLGANTTYFAPQNLTIMVPGPGYTCESLQDTDPTVFPDIGGRRQVQVFRTWKSICTYSTFVANKAPACCVSLSTFYNPTITSCPLCSCGCRPTDQNATSCIREGYNLPQSDFVNSLDFVKCTDHMCPVRVHWHVKNNYMDHWRIKLTVSNYNYNKNYSDWNVLVQHPGFSQKSTAYSFNGTVLPAVGFAEEFALFWGISYFNEELLQADEDQEGSVTTDILLEKDLESFTFRNGWGFPRRIYFNGEDCEMPLPDTFPMLPNSSSTLKPTNNCFWILLLLLLLTFLTFKTQK
ncbi:hypothetical protein LWI28_002109 [Acer negundo]|uniref:COBRA-like protein n=1 Tax=Acer negundo TaxID=4023 RepID=A0AAD5NST7_ACENE|nr:hypothetical protein LWI28_002109 [Acer negundo]